ncbi:MAG: thioredoxin family protein [Bacteroidota bacterium]|nr:thioredoxin family protein [Bacteroidota bacterium]
MKKTQIIIATLLLSLLVSCNLSEKDRDIGSGFDYLIQGHVINGDSIEISLYRPGMGMDERQTVTITDGKYQFSGTAQLPEAAIIRFEKDIVDPGPVSCIATVFIEQDSVKYDFEIDKRDFGYCFKNHNYLAGRNNLYYASSKDKFFESARTWIYGDQKKMDSMHKFVYPEIKTNTLNVYEELFYQNENQIVSLYFLDNIAINNRKIFDPAHLTQLEKEKLRFFMEGIDPEFHSTKGYIFLQNHITNLLSEGQIKGFKDFQLINTNNEITGLADHIKPNQVTMLYFWFSGCGPCRKFNRETSKIYGDLKEQGIEIISINSDQSKEYWKKSSVMDSITWTNLYAGDKAEISAYYNIHRYPTTLVYDKSLNLLGTGISNAEELKQFLVE